MEQSIGKQVARDLLYRRCIPDWLSEEQLLSGRFLILLGQEDRQLHYLDEHGIPREHVTSVEIDLDIYHAQRSLELGINLARSDIGRYLRSSLHRDNRFTVLDLDICGQYRVHLDPAMSPILFFCCRNPRTVVATYTNIGRDPHSIWEGAKSLAILEWIAPDLATAFLERVADFYAGFGFQQPLTCALRDLFWFRSIMEHTIAVSAPFTQEGATISLELLKAFDTIWDTLFNKRNKSLQIEHIRDGVRHMDIPDRARLDQPFLRVAIDRQQNVAYRAIEPWSQRCYFTRFELLRAPMSLSKWVWEAMRAFMAQPYLYVDYEGDIFELHAASMERRVTVNRRTRLIKNRRMFREFKPRSLDLVDYSHYDLLIQQIMMRLQLERMDNDMAKQATTRQRKKKEPLVRNGAFTASGKATVQQLAADGLNSDEILKDLKLSADEAPERSVRAYVARARRLERFVDVGSKKLNSYAENFIISLARRDVDVENVITRMPAQLPSRQIKRVYNKARSGR